MGVFFHWSSGTVQHITIFHCHTHRKHFRKPLKVGHSLNFFFLTKFKQKQNKYLNQHFCPLFMYISMPKCSCADDRSSDMHKALCLGRCLVKLFYVTFSEDLRHRHFVRQWFMAPKVHISLYPPSRVSAVLYNLFELDSWLMALPRSAWEFLEPEVFIHLRSIAYLLYR